MKKLDLAALGVEEMSDAQMMETNGGIFGALAWLVAGIIISECLDRGAKGDFMDGWNAAAR